MLLATTNAPSFCQHYLDKATTLGPTLAAVLQAGGCERKLEGLLSYSVRTWLQVHPGGTGLFCINEYKNADLVVAKATSIGTANLLVDAVIEVKFNYACQSQEFAPRTIQAVGQTRSYAEQLGRDSRAQNQIEAYVLYVVASHAGAVPTAGKLIARDAGWGYIGTSSSTLQQSIQVITNTAPSASAAVIDSAITQGGHGWELASVLVRA